MTTKLTTAEIVAQGKYLEPDFEPSSLTVAQLLGVFGYHNVNYPTTYTKPKLVQLFNDEIKPRGKKLQKERLSRQNSQASQDGITDGHTGKPLNDTSSDAPVRRSSRRVSRPSSREPSLVVPTVEPPKRRRSSAEPSLGGPSRRRATKPIEPTLAEESEPEEVVVRKVSRSKKSSADAGTQARKLAQEDADSGWEDNNIFQSGAESSSPLRPSPVRPLSPTKDKPPSCRAPSVKPPESRFEPDLPAEVIREPRSSIMRSARASAIPEAPKEVQPTVQAIPEEEELEEVQDEQAASPEYLESHEVVSTNEPLSEEVVSEPETGSFDQMSDSDKAIEVSRRIAGQGKQVVARPSTDVASPPASIPLIYRIAMLLLTLTTSYLCYDYKQEASHIGFCETGQTSNDVLRGLQAHWAAVDSCNRDNRTYLLPAPDGTQSVLSPVPTPTPSLASEINNEELTGMELCPAPPLLPIPRPDYCTPCPAHAVCGPSTMTCETGYLIRPHPLLFFLPLSVSPNSPHAQNSYTTPSYLPPTSSSGTVSELLYKGLSQILDGLPGLGPVALPPHCVEDPKRKARIGALGNAVETVLANHRGRLVCDGVSDQPTGSDADEAKKWGIEIEELKDRLKKEGMKKKLAPRLMDAFDENFNEAIQQLLQWGGVFLGEDASGSRYVAHKSLKMDLVCAAKVKARASWNQWRNQFFGTLLSVIAMIALRQRRARNVVEGQRVATLVQTALECLRNQELAHHTDPVTAPHPFLSSLQLRDLILQDEHSVSTRRRLWERVERVVEANANVRTNLEEVEGGDEMRVWRWVGSAGKTLGSSSPDADTERRTILSASAGDA
ncbi:Man1-Src1p-C-terminal domain-containing protein [Cristinia sonorae]|uniref:Man1-Src1p-C-terminal domain-containing protein n=1 Tax=Cristinia sonorae TaxID=1940300 RepID=A0A8K0UL16_9AGAR|nr:Man1-Src1p-C-terminal domain-containing protein [Cristinia sonorae]